MSVPNSAIYGVLSGNQTFVSPGETLYLPYASQIGISSFAVANVGELNVSSIVGLPGSSNVSMALDSVVISTCTVLGDIVMTGAGGTIGLGTGGAIATPFSTGTTTAKPLLIQGTGALDAGGSTIITTAPSIYNSQANFIALGNYRDNVLHTAPITTSTIGISSFTMLGDASALVSWTTIGYT